MSEKFYDKEIAPVLLELGRKCEKRGMSFVAMVEFAPNDTGTTMCIAGGAGIEVRLTAMAAQSRGNVDTLFSALVDYARQHGHNSMFLAQYVDNTPTRRKETT